MEGNQSSSPKSNLLPLSIFVAAIIIGGALIYRGGTGNLPNSANLKDQIKSDDSAALIDDDIILGDPNAPVTIVEFGDYQCPFCGRFFSEVEPSLKDQYVKTGKVKLIYRDFAFLGPESFMAAIASQCAADQGKFWEYHDKLFQTEILDGRENNGNLSANFLKSLAGQLSLNQKQFDSCLDTSKYQQEINKDYDDGIVLGVNGTPATFVNGKLFSGAQSFRVFKAAIDKELQK
ncbi:MAG: DsbA family protein [Patescibacteria group bacterium]